MGSIWKGPLNIWSNWGIKETILRHQSKIYNNVVVLVSLSNKHHWKNIRRLGKAGALESKQMKTDLSLCVYVFTSLCCSPGEMKRGICNDKYRFLSIKWLNMDDFSLPDGIGLKASGIW